ncbi:S1C family serine protease [Rubinisphaera brasiliensis]|uniref:Peptidase S1 and S6 chymotrypsin/Hap n=1 Tax=Rubinisphaera brasiliensis (strain ATCC 49424 / DSM 5305 / JCM 21570 / IAM 15109 / NBRC 103401 / IFAM 1448) TaxID=756272 RepID=F0SQ95_RUBBR|nr:trypsin-like peptidase domain-containing protein [Rubinisphaera brasiliensis]ADY62274.1 peptidase S1 and S6 chymotrypsin/Hap [Rubinisphaera brasiliensis DSM 5305]
MTALLRDGARIAARPKLVARFKLTFLPGVLALCGLASCPGLLQAELSPEVQQAEQKRVDTIARASQSVVAIFPPDGKGGGSGVLISSDGLTLTNFHVVQGAGPFLKCGLNDGKIYDAVLIGIDPTGDVAMIQLLGRDDFPAAPLGDSNTVEAGDWAFAMGNPFLLAEDFTPTLTYGMVSGVHRYQYPAGSILEYTDCIQVDTSINPGNSGGPLFNTDGEVIGINGRISVEKRGRVNAGAGYAISINQIKYFRDHLLSGRVVDHATLGATVRTDEFSNVIVDTILPSCNAFFQGLREGDEIVSFGGRPIGSVNQFKNVLGIYPKGWKVPLTYRRDGERYELFVRLEALHSAGELVDFASPPAPPESEDGEEPHGGPLPPGMPQLPGMHPPKMEIPEEYAHLFEGRLGFANYAFNVKKQEQLLEGLKRLGQFSEEPRKWTFEGVINDQAPYRLVITKVAGMLQVPSEQRVFLLDLGRPETHLAGWNNEGMLMAFYEFQQLLTHGADSFAEFYYVGSEPLDGNGPRVDVLATMEAGRECRWYFNQGQLVGWDTFVIPETPVCEVRLDGWESGENRPLGWTVNTPGQPPVRFSVSSLKTESFEVPELPTP